MLPVNGRTLVFEAEETRTDRPDQELFSCLPVAKELVELAGSWDRAYQALGALKALTVRLPRP